MIVSSIRIPAGRLGASADDKAAEMQRKRIAEMLRKGEVVTINQDGVLHAPGQEVRTSSGMGGSGRVVPGEVELIVPSGKLAAL